ncbi:hypothetical protein SAMN04515674_101166 [Pseudarcicella hirudinis]|uniref:Uncharacterized protein n=1 Tax=Pseudarcicella hirudinis TaxID=1079859 RepID=A0A1I5M777_9BACT|nr:hypothetical protein [Pseudarcicella hirudinis]SFP05434.1 hypothetical protein SAMN04515674_101166 [Pseudarcicella hirudinis]
MKRHSLILLLLAVIGAAACQNAETVAPRPANETKSSVKGDSLKLKVMEDVPQDPPILPSTGGPPK